MLTIRPARLEDDGALLPIDQATWTDDVSPSVPAEPADHFFDADASLQDFLVAESNGEVVGYVRLDRPSPLPSHQHVVLINGLAVAPDEQGAGVGRALVLAALDEARARGASKVTLRVLGPNTRARRLYESCGFVVEGVLRGEFLLQGRLVDDVLMALHLDLDRPHHEVDA